MDRMAHGRYFSTIPCYFSLFRIEVLREKAWGQTCEACPRRAQRSTLYKQHSPPIGTFRAWSLFSPVHARGGTAQRPFGQRDFQLCTRGAQNLRCIFTPHGYSYGPMGPCRNTYVRSLARGLSVIRSFSPDSPAQTVTQLAKKTGLDRASASRFLYTLEALGYVRREGSEFRLTARVLNLARVYFPTTPLWIIVEEALQKRCRS